MKLTGIDIEQYGPWQRLSLPLSEHPMQTIYGPNEAGKSTLMRFIRGVLYGYEETELEGPQFEQTDRWSGSLTLEYEGESYRLQRSGPAHETGVLTIDGLKPGQTADDLMAKITGSTDAGLYKNVFAVGLDEVQHLATLHEEEVAQHVYGLTLGPEGRRILNTSSNSARSLQSLYDPQTESGELPRLLREEAKLSKAVHTAEQQTKEYSTRKAELDQLQSRISELKQEQKRLQENQRGLRFMEMIYKPWKQVYDLENQLSDLPGYRTLPENGLERLHRLDGEIQQLRHRRRSERESYKSRQEEQNRIRPPQGLRGQTALMADLLSRRDWARDRYHQMEALQDRLLTADDKLQQQVSPFLAAHPGFDWKKVDVNPANTHLMMQTSRAYQRALSRQKRQRNRYDKLHQGNQDREQKLEKVRKALNGLTFAEAVQKARLQFANVKRRLELQLQKKAFQERLDQTQLQMARLEERIALPSIAYLAITIFVLGGLFFVSLGLFNAFQTQYYFGALYFFLGLTAAGLGWAIKSQFRQAHSGTVQEAQDDLFDTNKKIRSIQQEIDSLISPEEKSAGLNAQDVDESVIDQAYRRLQELEKNLRTEKRCLKERERLTLWRQKSQELQKEVSTARHNWCQQLRQIGLPESTQIEPSWQLWTETLELHAKSQQVRQLEQELQVVQNDYDQFIERVETIENRLNPQDSNGTSTQSINLPELFGRWEAMLGKFRQWKTSSKQHKLDLREQKRGLGEIQQRWEELRTERSGLLEQAGVHSILEYQALEQQLKKREDLELQLELAREELHEAASLEPELAIVGDDLLHFQPEENQDRLAMLSLEEEEVTEKLNRQLEQSGGIKQALIQLEQDHTLMRLRFQQAQLQSTLKRKVTQWLGTRLTREATFQIQSRFERHQQPEVLATASSYLAELTRGKYRNVWTPLGERYLCLDDQEQHTFRVEQVSRGTRELLFLAIRMAIIEQFKKQNIQLPFVLDDVLVNFDHLRTESTIDFLLKRAEQGQQIMLFTCHQHLVKMLEEKGVESLQLPGRESSQLENRWAG